MDNFHLTSRFCENKLGLRVYKVWIILFHFFFPQFAELNLDTINWSRMWEINYICVWIKEFPPELIKFMYKKETELDHRSKLKSHMLLTSIIKLYLYPMDRWWSRRASWILASMWAGPLSSAKNLVSSTLCSLLWVWITKWKGSLTLHISFGKQGN